MDKSSWVLLLALVLPQSLAQTKKEPPLEEPRLNLVSVALGETISVTIPTGNKLIGATLDFPTSIRSQVQTTIAREKSVKREKYITTPIVKTD